MPGFILNIAIDSHRSLAASKAICYNDKYTYKTLFDSDKLTLSFNAYANYPNQIFESDIHFCLLEGCMYGVNANDEVSAILSHLGKGENAEISDRIKSIDGEFVLVIICKKDHTVTIINDAWGRLPIYYIQSGDSLIVTREISFIKEYHQNIKLSQLDLALFLMFGYTLGNTTIFEGVLNLNPHSIFSCKGGSIDFHTHSAFDLKSLFDAAGEPSVQELNDDLKFAMESRLQQFSKPSLSLSGGLDSRLLAGVWAMTDHPKFFTTFSRPDSNTLIDIVIAKKIVDALQPDVRHEIIEMSESTEDSYNKIIAFKSGMNGQEVAFMIPYLEKIAGWSDCSITGDGGDKFFANLFPLMKTSNRKQLINAIVKFNAAIDISTASQLCCVSEESVLNKIHTTLDSYQIEDSNAAYAAFLIRERGINWLFEGEDRNRFIIWSTSPFYSPKVIEQAMKFSMASKNYGALFISLFDLVPGGLQNFINPNWKLPPTATKKIKWVHDKQLIKSKLPKRLTERNGILFKDSPVYQKWNDLTIKPPLDISKIENTKLTIALLNRVDTLVRITKLN